MILTLYRGWPVNNYHRVVVSTGTAAPTGTATVPGTRSCPRSAPNTWPWTSPCRPGPWAPGTPAACCGSCSSAAAAASAPGRAADRTALPRWAPRGRRRSGRARTPRATNCRGGRRTWLTGFSRGGGTARISPNVDRILGRLSPAASASARAYSCDRSGMLLARDD